MDECPICKVWQLDCARVTDDEQRCIQGTGAAQHDRCAEPMLLKRAHKLVVLCTIHVCLTQVQVDLCTLHLPAAGSGHTTM